MFQANDAEKITTHTLCAITFSPKSCHVGDDVEKYGIEPYRPQMTHHSAFALHDG
jgi:hypothetical protein